MLSPTWLLFHRPTTCISLLSSSKYTNLLINASPLACLSGILRNPKGCMWATCVKVHVNQATLVMRPASVKTDKCACVVVLLHCFCPHQGKVSSNSSLSACVLTLRSFLLLHTLRHRWRDLWNLFMWHLDFKEDREQIVKTDVEPQRKTTRLYLRITKVLSPHPQPSSVSQCVIKKNVLFRSETPFQIRQSGNHSKKLSTAPC